MLDMLSRATPFDFSCNDAGDGYVLGCETRKSRSEVRLETPDPSLDLDLRQDQPFTYRVDGAISFCTKSTLKTSKCGRIDIRDPDYTLRKRIEGSDTYTMTDFPALVSFVIGDTRHYFELSADEPVTVGRSRDPDADQETYLAPEGVMDVTHGIRVDSRYPRTSMTVPPTPEGVAEALSHFGGVLGTKTPTRSWPNQRQHPPQIQDGDEFIAPDGLSPPDTPATIVVRDDLSRLYPIAPLAYFTPATVELTDGKPESRSPGLYIDGEQVVSFPATQRAAGRAFQSTVEDTLHRFVLGSVVTRSGGPYKLDTPTLTQIADEYYSDVDLETFYQKPLAERLRRHLELPDEALERYPHEWPSEVQVPPDIDHRWVLSRAADQLSFTRVAPRQANDVSTPNGLVGPGPAQSGVETSVRGESATESATQPSPGPDTPGTKTPSSSPSPTTSPSQHTPASDLLPTLRETIVSEYVGLGMPESGNEPVRAGVVNGAERIRNVGSPSQADDDFSLDIHIVNQLNDEIVPYDPTGVFNGGITGDEYFTMAAPAIHENVTTAKLRSLLESDTDILFFTGHASENGLHCVDGKLDLRSLPPNSVNVDLGILNACSSYPQGRAFLDRGGVAAMVSTKDVLHFRAVKFGQLSAKFLSHGFQPRDIPWALDVIGADELPYTILGESRLSFSRYDPTIYKIRTATDTPVTNTTEGDSVSPNDPADYWFECLYGESRTLGRVASIFTNMPVSPGTTPGLINRDAVAEETLLNEPMITDPGEYRTVFYINGSLKFGTEASFPEDLP